MENNKKELLKQLEEAQKELNNDSLSKKEITALSKTIRAIEKEIKAIEKAELKELENRLSCIKTFFTYLTSFGSFENIMKDALEVSDDKKDTEFLLYPYDESSLIIQPAETLKLFMHTFMKINVDVENYFVKWIMIQQNPVVIKLSEIEMFKKIVVKAPAKSEDKEKKVVKTLVKSVQALDGIFKTSGAIFVNGESTDVEWEHNFKTININFAKVNQNHIDNFEQEITFDENGDLKFINDGETIVEMSDDMVRVSQKDPLTKYYIKYSDADEFGFAKVMLKSVSENCIICQSMNVIRF